MKMGSAGKRPYQGFYEALVPEIVRLDNEFFTSGQIARHLSGRVSPPISTGMVRYILERYGRPNPQPRKVRAEFFSAPRAWGITPWKNWKPKSRPIDMGGPRDVWLVFYPGDPL